MRGPWEYEDPSCRGVDTEMYYPAEQGQTVPELPLIRSVCGKCVHQDECAQWGINHERFGIWGGLTENQRRQIRKAKNITLPFGEFCA